MSKDNFDSITDKKTIQQILEKMFKYKNTLEVVQQNPFRIMSQITTIEMVNYYTKELILRPKNLNIPFFFNKKQPLSVNNGKDSLRFYTRIGKIKFRKLMSIKWPVTLLQSNTRSARRYYLETDRLMINFTNFSMEHNLIQNITQEAQLLDISRTGIALKSYENIIQSYNKNDKLIFTAFNTSSLQMQITGEIVYIKKISDPTNDKFFSMGIKFDNAIPFEDILKMLGYHYTRN